MVNPDKKRLFDNEGATFLSFPNATEYREEYNRCNCNDCPDRDCIARSKYSRFPADVGGNGQCLRNESAKNPFTFRNVDGTVISIPQKIVDCIRELEYN